MLGSKQAIFIAPRLQNDHNNAGTVPDIAAPRISIRGSRNSSNDPGDANQAPCGGSAHENHIGREGRWLNPLPSRDLAQFA